MQSTMLGEDVACWVTIEKHGQLVWIPCLAGYVKPSVKEMEEMQKPLDYSTAKLQGTRL